MRLPTLSFIIVISPKVPTLGSRATTVNVICVDALFQLVVLDCMAVISVFPPSTNVTLLPKTVATAGFDEVNVHFPSDVEIGEVKIMDLAIIDADCGANAPNVGVPGLTLKNVERDLSV